MLKNFILAFILFKIFTMPNLVLFMLTFLIIKLDFFESKVSTIKNEDELKELFNKKNIKNNDEVVFYCGSGTSCAVNAFTWNKITGKSPQIYMGSWSEFGKK